GGRRQAGPLGEPGAPAGDDGPQRDARRAVAIEAQEIDEPTPFAALAARIECGHADVAREPAEDVPGVGREREAPLRGEVEAARMESRKPDKAAEDHDDREGLDPGHDRGPTHQTPRHARAPSARTERKRKRAPNARRYVTSRVSMIPSAKP